jgi:alkanesulfonate monooxygenase SsuD/methylene tetrahydromethanopterin reductase-like flavin-dependent oxidoreductase (luciferase family)
VRFGARIVPAAADAAALARCAGLAARAEALGLDWLAVAERWDASGGVPDALSVCAALAAATERIRIATAALPLPLHHPLRVAEIAATLDSLSGGRLELGVGLGAAEVPFGSFGLAADERAERFAEALAILRGAWSDAPLTFRGKHFTCEAVVVFPKPARAGGPPLWLAASAPAALRRAAHLDVGVMLPLGADAAPYLAEAAARGATARVAWLAAADAPVALLAEAIESCRVAEEIVCALDTADERDLERAAEIARELTLP